MPNTRKQSDPASNQPIAAAGEHSLRSPAVASPNDPFFESKHAYAELEVWRQSVLNKISRHEALKEEAKLWYPDLAPGAAIVEQVGQYELQVSARSVEKDWASMRKVFTAVGSLSKFLKLVKVTFKALAEEIGAEKAEALQVEERTGSRRIKAFQNRACIVRIAS